MAWRLDNESTVLESQILGGSVQAIPTADGWSIRVDQLILQADDNTLVTDLVGRVDNTGKLTINTVKPISLAPIMALAPLFAEGSSGKLIKRLSPAAELATPAVAMAAKDLVGSGQGL